MVADLRYAFRALAGSHGFTLAAVLTMALGIGASTTIFTLLYGVLLKPLPYGDPHRLVWLTEGRPGFSLNVSYPNFTDWRARNQVFEDMAIFNTLGTVVIPAVSGPADVFPAGHCEARLFSVLGLRPALGRFFIESDQQPSEALVVVISDALWRRRFGSDRSVVGRAVRIDDDLATILGVLPPDVRPESVDVWFPIRGFSAMQLDRANHPGFGVVARLRRGIHLDDARREMRLIAAQLEREYPVSNHDLGVFVTPLLDPLSARIRPTLTALSAAVNVLLLLACANVASLLLARGLARERETSIRGALGATRLRLIRLFVIEGLVLGIAGGTAGLLLAGWGVRLLEAVPGLALPRRADIALDPHVLAFAVALAVATALLFTFAPAIQLSRVDLTRALRLAGSPDNSTPRSMRLRSALVAIEVALLLVLLAGAALMHRTLANLAGIDPGFRADGLIAVQLVQLQSKYGSNEALVPFAKQVIAAINETGGGRRAALAWPFDYTSFSWSPNINLPDRPFAPGAEPVAQAASVTPGYFETMGTLRGGMLGGVTPEIYVSYFQFPQAGGTVVVRTAGGDLLGIQGDINARLASIDPGVAVSGIKRLSDQLAATYGDRSALSWLLGVFATLALGLTIVGIASVVSFPVVQRTEEIGIRMALGASSSGVMGLVVRDRLAPVALGAVCGLGLLIALAGVARSYVFGVSPLDPASLAMALFVLFAAAAGAAYLPARHAAGIDPLRTMWRS